MLPQQFTSTYKSRLEREIFRCSFRSYIRTVSRMHRRFIGAVTQRQYNVWHNSVNITSISVSFHPGYLILIFVVSVPFNAFEPVKINGSGLRPTGFLSDHLSFDFQQPSRRTFKWQTHELARSGVVRSPSRHGKVGTIRPETKFLTAGSVSAPGRSRSSSAVLHTNKPNVVEFVISRRNCDLRGSHAITRHNWIL